MNVEKLQLKIKECLGDDYTPQQLRQTRVLCSSLIQEEKQRCHRFVQDATNKMLDEG